MPNRNGVIHEGIIDILRFGLPDILDEQYNNYLCIADEGTMAKICNKGNGGGSRPDLILFINNELIIIEVGGISKHRWYNLSHTLIHISHHKSVGIINNIHSDISRNVLLIIRKILNVL